MSAELFGLSAIQKHKAVGMIMYRREEVGIFGVRWWRVSGWWVIDVDAEVSVGNFVGNAILIPSLGRSRGARVSLAASPDHMAEVGHPTASVSGTEQNSTWLQFGFSLKDVRYFRMIVQDEEKQKGRIKHQSYGPQSGMIGFFFDTKSRLQTPVPKNHLHVVIINGELFKTRYGKMRFSKCDPQSCSYS